jgi:Raf kinase inhibitor-like YbhB/YbcL family protein
MRNLLMLSATLVLGLAICGVADAAPKKPKKPEGAKLAVTSVEVLPGKTIAEEQVLKGFGCTGGNVSPSIAWSGAPAATKSFALSVYDPDAPTGSGFWHWVVFNIPPSVTSLPKGAGDASKGLMPAGAVQSRTDFGVPGWGGPCPPAGDKPHHYHFTVFAVDVDHLDLNADTSAAVVGFMLHFHTVAKGTLTGLYGRSK